MTHLGGKVRSSGFLIPGSAPVSGTPPQGQGGLASSRVYEDSGGSFLSFSPMIHPNLAPIIAPSAYARLNLLNHCIFLEAFKKENSGQGLGGVQREVLFLKRDIIKQVIARIVAADSTLDLVNHGEPGREAPRRAQ
ncbi:UNVERIFIED_ASMBLY: DNA packaging protein UL33 [human gammaherpesvirus 4]|nr:DNA packaging protein UL33 [human gammaherpesvirus 4]